MLVFATNKIGRLYRPMVDPLIAFAAIKAASTSISAAVKAGRDLSSLAGPITKYAKAEAELQHGAATKKKSIFAKLGATDESAIEKHFRQEEVRRLRSDMRELFLLYGAPGQWERLQATIAEERAEKQRQLKLQQHKKEQIIQTIIAIIVVGIAVAALVGWVWLLQNA